ncbi:MAG: UDP-N-acetylmuramate dehydrogenase [bacterium]
MNLVLELQKITNKVKLNEPMSCHTYFKVGGLADIFVEVGNEGELKQVVSLCAQFKTPFFVLGGGSNVLVTDKGIRGVVIKLVDEFKKIRWLDNGRIITGAGVELPKLVNLTCKRGLSGLEFAVGIPGTIGGAVIGNAGIQEKSIGDCVSFVKILDNKLSHKECGFSYRNSNLRKYVILEVEILLKKAEISHITTVLQDYKQKRKDTQPQGYRSAGCIFKNPPGNFAGKLIDDVGLKGLRIGGAYISNKHANFILNDGTATAMDILNLITKIKKSVFDKFGIGLEEEIIII